MVRIDVAQPGVAPLQSRPGPGPGAGPGPIGRDTAAEQPRPGRGVANRRCLLLAPEPAGPADLATSLTAAGLDLAGEIDAPAAVGCLADPHTVLWVLSGPEVLGEDTAALAARRGWPVVVLALSSDPRFVTAAIAAGAAGYLIAPFTRARLLPTLELATARIAEISELRADVNELKERLDTRKVVERAKGLLMSQRQLSEQAAFRLIQRTAMDRRTSMRAVADAIASQLAGAA